MEEVPRPRRHQGLLELVLQAQQGSEEAWEKLFETVERVVRRRCLLDKPKILKSRLRDSDIVQEVAIKAHQGMGEFRGKTAQEFIIWVSAITQNLINDYYREYLSSQKSAVKKISLESLEQKGQLLAAQPDDHEQVRERIDKSLDALARLPDRYFWVIELRMDEGLTFQEIGARMGCKAEAARKICRRGLEIIREELTEPE
jgi:RNA polymerase sigma-70 factor (ECF subfamily)